MNNQKFTLLSLLLICWTLGLSAQVSITTDSSEPDPSAMLDVKSTDKGLLIPRMTAAERDAVPAPADGLMVYVTTDSSFYYYKGDAWAKVGRSGWSLSGNAGTVDSTHFIGTTDSVPLELKVNNFRVLRLEYDGDPDSTPNIIGGSGGNSVEAGLGGATISGGGVAEFNTQNSNFFNSITGNGEFGTIGGGIKNNISGKYATIPGGYGNVAKGDHSFAAGTVANATHRGAMLFSDSENAFYFNSAAAMNSRYGPRAACALLPLMIKRPLRRR